MPLILPRALRPVVSLLLASVLLAGCIGTPVPVARPSVDPGGAARFALSPQDVLEVAELVEAPATALCRAQLPRGRCDFAILLDRDPRLGPNAFQTEGQGGQPVVIVTLSLVALMQSRDELAFVLGHEAGHHIAQHIPAQRASAMEGAAVLGDLARQRGGTDRDIARAAQLGAVLGARRFSQGAEIEADIIGTVIAWEAGFDPERGAALFGRLPEPADAFLSTHPPNSARLAAVRETQAELERIGR